MAVVACSSAVTWECTTTYMPRKGMPASFAAVSMTP
ncbi:hypothetical protein VAB18032_22730 [Micromonospora maris AB-18-032]|nr:hypothetical protein VAB18032_22730 [Micromonospora maris AB-18-032]